MNDTRLIAGASGYSFKEWKGSFYPEKIKPDEMLAWYSERLPTVEINNTFYQMPKTAVLETWANATPEHFRFAIKASRRITHDARLKADAAAGSVEFLYRTLGTLGAPLTEKFFVLRLSANFRTLMRSGRLPGIIRPAWRISSRFAVQTCAVWPATTYAVAARTAIVSSSRASLVGIYGASLYND